MIHRYQYDYKNRNGDLSFHILAINNVYNKGGEEGFVARQIERNKSPVSVLIEGWN